MAARYLIDTDVIIEYLRGQKRAAEYLEGVEGDLILSAITVAELYSGVRSADEEAALEQFLLAFEVLLVDEEIGKRAGEFRRQYFPSYGTGLADALIAASAKRSGATLVTLNRRHYPMLDKVDQPYQRE